MSFYHHRIIEIWASNHSIKESAWAQEWFWHIWESWEHIIPTYNSRCNISLGWKYPCLLFFTISSKTQSNWISPIQHAHIVITPPTYPKSEHLNTVQNMHESAIKSSGTP